MITKLSSTMMRVVDELRDPRVVIEYHTWGYRLSRNASFRYLTGNTFRALHRRGLIEWKRPGIYGLTDAGRDI
jgi:hypothetical protein